ncbi:winged helix-turn-helix transcriptional regulator [Erythrobacter sp. EC-HK427]|uniref:winged helix-turn-helix transcriptional regulator n=1 Tax=Erythrobacter sp. EC-HK427 TaxID=2038396 RepID=UPI0012584A1B|nr:helix-turn-helix domain-containing protein [Erythrobacter sp. EC-HK427]VVT19895.1 Transcriptional regulator [Erythrobacter sp. EC-HK427]
MKLPKETKSGHGKWYGDACGTAFAMEVIGERWALLIVRELMFGALRFSDLRAGMPGISAKVLTERLAGLEAAGVLIRRKLAPPAAGQVYELTAWGYAAETAIMEMGRWAAMSCAHDPTLPLSPASLMMSFRTMFDPALADGLEADLGFVVAGQAFRATVRTDSLKIRRTPAEGAQAILHAPAAPLVAAHVYGDVPLAELAAVRVEGDATVLARFVASVKLPPKIG